jgi:hypothetical protein
MKTKPFNLEEALAGKPVVTRDGREVKKITKFDVNQTNPYSVYALLGTQTSNFDDVNEIIGSWTESGKYIAGTSEENPLDLFMKVEVNNETAIDMLWNLIPTDTQNYIVKQFNGLEKAKEMEKEQRSIELPSDEELWKWWQTQKFQKEQGEQEYTMLYEIDLPKILKAFIENFSKIQGGEQ